MKGLGAWKIPVSDYVQLSLPPAQCITLIEYQSLRENGSTVFFLRPFFPFESLLFLFKKKKKSASVPRYDALYIPYFPTAMVARECVTEEVELYVGRLTEDCERFFFLRTYSCGCEAILSEDKADACPD